MPKYKPDWIKWWNIYTFTCSIPRQKHLNTAYNQYSLLCKPTPYNKPNSLHILGDISYFVGLCYFIFCVPSKPIQKNSISMCGTIQFLVYNCFRNMELITIWKGGSLYRDIMSINSHVDGTKKIWPIGHKEEYMKHL